MATRRYLSKIVTNDSGFEPAISAYLSSQELSWSGRDLRTKEQQFTTNGRILVIMDVSPAQHNAIVASGNAVTLKAALDLTEARSVLGDEGFEDAVDLSDSREAFRKAARIRQRRFGLGRR